MVWRIDNNPEKVGLTSKEYLFMIDLQYALRRLVRCDLKTRSVIASKFIEKWINPLAENVASFLYEL